MYQNIASPSPGAKVPVWTRVMTFLRSMDEAVSRTEADDLIDRIVALERRVDSLAPDEAASGKSTADRRPYSGARDDRSVFDETL